jgi:hypothetical protein
VLAQNIGVLWHKHIVGAFEKEHPEDVFLVFGRVHLAAQNVGGGEEMAFEPG